MKIGFVYKSKLFYKSIVSVYCPLLEETVFFTSNGFNHLLYESNRKPRKISEQFMKLKCLEFVPEVIKRSNKISETRKLIRIIKNINKEVVHYELIYEVEDKKNIRVILEKIGTGKLHFLSVMPNNKASKKRR